VGQFFGHTHHDSVEIHYDDKNVSRATNVVYISQSVTTYQYLNLGYRIFIIDGDYDESTSCVVDHVNYYMDLSKTSETTPPLWEFEYSAKADYEMADLQPQSWADLVLRFQKNNTLFMKYYHHDSKMYSADHGHQCDGVCVCELLCETVTAVAEDRSHCVGLAPIVGNRTVSCDYVDTTEFHKSRQHC
jgi:sphingomyelin phosphodiesterase